MTYLPVRSETEEIGRTILDEAFSIHTEVGPGMLEKFYREALRLALVDQGIPCLAEVTVPVKFRGRPIDQALRIDLLVADSVIVEIKASSANHPTDVRQLATYLAMTGIELGFVLNFGRAHLRQGMRRVIHTAFQREDPSSVVPFVSVAETDEAR